MTAKDIRSKFLEFFKENNHVVVSSSSLVPEDDSVLLTTAGMQQFKPYYLGEKSPYGPNTVSCQKSFRTSDIEEIGDETHLTFFEMLGNFSFGGYFKKQAINLAFDFLTKKLGLKIDYVSIFIGDKNVPQDQESEKIWLDLGIKPEKIKKFGREDNFWGPTGEQGPCGPTTEIYINGTEIWNLVFNEYYQDKDGQLTYLKQKGVDTGMGLERLATIIQQKNNIFETDLFFPIIEEIRKNKDVSLISLKEERIIADHIRGAVFLISDKVLPSNIDRGYILRRILRRTIRYNKLIGLPENFIIYLADKVIQIYQHAYPELKQNQEEILSVIQEEQEKFSKVLEKGIEKFNQITAQKKIKGTDVFHLFDTYGFPLELTEELAKEKQISFDRKEFEQAFKNHQQISRAGKEKKFGGIGKNADYQSIKLHTATHLLQASLRKVLGEQVKQAGSDITSQRLRFDFFYPRKLTKQELEKAEEMVNQKIKQDLKVEKKETTYQQAVDSGALSFFKEKYPEKVFVYSVNNFSKEICAGPHVEKTSEIGLIKIIKEESSSAGVRRIKAVLINN